MWRTNTFPANQDSDQSISDEEEFEFHGSERCVSLDGPSKKEQPNLALQFELLSGGIEARERRECIIDEKNAGFSSEDEVEMPVFKERDSDGEKNNDENGCVCSASATSWPKIHEKLTSNVQKLPKLKGMSSAQVHDGRVREQPNPLDFHSCHQQVVWHSITAEEDLESHEPPRLEQSVQAVEYDSQEEAAANPVEDLQEKSIHELEDAIIAKGFGGHECVNSMADLFDGLQEKNCGPFAIPKRVGRKGMRKKGIGGNTSMIEKEIANDEDLCEIIDSGSSSDNESKDRSVVLTTPKAKKKTMADQFQEALGATCVNEGAPVLMSKQSRARGSGLLEKLQRVIQREKELDSDFMKNMRSEIVGDEVGYIDVKVLSRSFEAKLTVCLCSINCYKKSSVLIEKSEEERFKHRTRTIIFSSRTCGSVELDADTCVRIYSPWKEVRVRGGDIVILASYFTQTLA